MKTVVLPILCLLAFATSAQNLLSSRQSSAYTYIFRITNKEAARICRADTWEADPAYLHTLVDSFHTDSVPALDLPQGHYLKTAIRKNQLIMEVTTVQDFDVAIFNNSADLCVAVQDSLGRALPGAIIKAGHRRIRFDEKTQLYRLAKANKKGWLTVEYGGLKTWHQLDRKWNNGALIRTVNNKPLRYVWRPVRFVLRLPVDAYRSVARGRSQGTVYQIANFFVRAYDGVICLFDEYYCAEDKEDRFTEKWRGYLVFNKPKYQPGDTVKFKAFITDKKGRPLTDSASVVLHKTWKDRKIMARLAPYQPGGYAGEFVLHDSLGLRLDQYYTVSLQKRKERIYFEESLRYEDYELSSVALSMRSDAQRHFRGQDFEIFLKGTDENDLNLADARVEMTLRPLNVLKFHDKSLFLPDTLLRLEEILEPSGETTLIIPEAIFPALDLEYEVSVAMLTADNERISKKETFRFYHQLEEFTFELRGDSIRFLYQRNGKSIPKQAKLAGHDRSGNTIAEHWVNLPHQEKLNAHFEYYELKTDSLQQQLNLNLESPLLRCLSDRDADSIRILVENPRRNPFRYFIYDLNKEVERGYGTALDRKRATGNTRNYSIVLQYLWAGKVKENSYAIGHDPLKLNVEVEQPALIYPGQSADIRVMVTDQQGRPVSNADLTAYGLTKKFNAESPILPDFDGGDTRRRKLINTFSLEEVSPAQEVALLNYAAWRSKAGLDTIEYYDFLYPGRDLYQFETVSPDSVAQFAPFVVREGAIQPVHVVYLDQKPVYFSWSENERPYSFRATPGYHRVELRTSDRFYRIDSLYIPAHRKLVLSLSDSIQSRKVKITPMPPSLNKDEKNNLYRYIFPYRYAFGDQFPYLQQGKEVFLLESENHQHNLYGAPDYAPYRNRGTFMAGPVMPDYATFVLPDAYRTEFEYEPFFEYDFSKALLKMRSVDAGRRYPTLLAFSAKENLKDRVFSASGILERRQTFFENQRRSLTRYSYPLSTPPDKGKLQVQFGEAQSAATPLNLLLFQLEDSVFVRVYPGQANLFHALSPGHYRLVLIYPDARYALLDSIPVKVGGLNYYVPERPTMLPRDSFSMRMNELLEKRRETPQPNNYGADKEIREFRDFYQDAFTWSGPGELIRGRVTDENGEPLIGASVLVKGTSSGTVTDIDGYYSLVIRGGEKLVFSYTGFNVLEVPIGAGYQVDAKLQGGVQLDEVVVTGYGAINPRYFSGPALTSESISSLSTRNINALSATAAGISVEESGDVAVRGTRADGVLYYVDGIRVQGTLIPALEKEDILKTEVLQGESATAIFGPEAANGVVLITTKKGDKGANFDEAFLEVASQANSIRSNFSDYAFWQPKLRTDGEGKATFKVTFPDDITNWRTFVLAMNDRKQTGQTDGNIRSFKPLAARLSLPRFLVQGDSAWAIGKVLNYLPDTVSLRAGFALGEAEAALRDYRVADAVTDSVLLSPTTTDSLQVKFLLQKPDGYTDGEQRSIEVLPMGLERTAGKFLALNGDTTLQWTFPDSLGEVRLYARADVLDVVEEEIARLIDYEYDCNEQMASRLRALLAEEQIAAFKNRKFTRKAQAQKLINRILDNQNDRGLWGWWNQSATSYWISTHVLEALVEAKKKGYAVQLPEQKITKQAIWELESNVPNARKLELLYLLNSFDAKFKYDNYLPFIEKDTTLSTFDRFRLMELQQRHGLAWNRDTLAHYRQETLFGNVYFSGGKKGFSLDRNTLQITLAAYRILQRDSLPDKALLAHIRNYFLEERSRGQWNNTYETAQIIATILPGLQTRGDSLQMPSVRLSGGKTADITSFPYQTTIAPGQPLTVSVIIPFILRLTSAIGTPHPAKTANISASEPHLPRTATASAPATLKNWK
jgi:TonB-dependent SusC/RagA subfamily outer membrane receptor